MAPVSKLSPMSKASGGALAWDVGWELGETPHHGLPSISPGSPQYQKTPCLSLLDLACPCLSLLHLASSCFALLNLPFPSLRYLVLALLSSTYLLPSLPLLVYYPPSPPLLT